MFSLYLLLGVDYAEVSLYAFVDLLGIVTLLLICLALLFFCFVFVIVTVVVVCVSVFAC